MICTCRSADFASRCALNPLPTTSTFECVIFRLILCFGLIVVCVACILLLLELILMIWRVACILLGMMLYDEVEFVMFWILLHQFHICPQGLCLSKI
jgi:hypothetical protein